MANMQSRKKQVRKDIGKRITNKQHKSSFRTAIKQFNSAVEANDKDTANELLNLSIRLLDRSVVRGVSTKNYAARRKSSLQRTYNALEA